MTVSIEMVQKVAVITMDDGKANAVCHPLLDALTIALDRAEREARAVVLGGRNGFFSAGFDLRVMQGDDRAAAQDLARRGFEMLRRIYAYPLPVVAAATGHSVALGAFWLLACDVRLGARGDYKFGLNETAIGITFPPSSIAIARDRLAPSCLTEVILFSQMFETSDAVDAGFLDFAFEGPELRIKALEHAQELSNVASETYAANKRLFRADTLKIMDEDLSANRLSVS